MTVASLAGIVYKTGWYFYALGPQLVICMLFGYLAARKTAGDLLNWLIVAFLAALVPLAGVLIMIGLWWRAGVAVSGNTVEDKGPPA
jgi:hypothetical protein